MTEEDKKRKARGTRLLKVYGITIEEWEEKLADQDGVCFICRTFPKSGVLCTDHIHVSGFAKLPAEKKKKYVRGLLCFLCNTAIRVYERTGNGKRNREMLEGTLEYFKTYSIKGEIIK